MSHQPLEGITVIELSTMITASLAAMMLAEQGARVIKIEPIEQGDPMRYLGTSKGGMSGLFANCNRGKESIRVNLKTPEGQALVQRLARTADLMLHNFRPGVMDSLELGSEALREANPKLVYLAISGFGTEGPLRRAPAYDPVVQAHSGIAAVQGGDAPAFVRNLVCDKITAYTACQAVTAALFKRERSGQGQHIDLSMLDASLFFLYPDGFMNHTLLDEDPLWQPLLSDLIYDLTVTKDGAVTISASTDAQRLGVYRAVGREDLATDPRFASLELMLANMAEHRAILGEAFAALETEEVLERLRANDVPAAKCLSRDEVIEDAQLAATETFQMVDHPIMGRLRAVASPAKFGGERLLPASPSPGHGEHTVAVLEGLGVDPDEMAQLTEAGIIA
jgi:crotonobetainyl-CoA:carnitine CoA-transferase CaiB-like acyl-CoA transferase